MSYQSNQPDADRRKLLRALGGAGLAGFAAHQAWASGLLPTPPNLQAANGSMLKISPSRAVGPLQAADANGVRLPQGFTSRIVARSGQRVAGTNYTWHATPDGGATLARPEGGWIYVGNSEVDKGKGGASALVFNRHGEITDAYRICSGTSRNCAGGMTPWGTYLSCEEVSRGRVYECDPLGKKAALRRDAMGLFEHEAAAVDPQTGYVYLTEDKPDGCLYRFVPTQFGNLASGTLEVACTASADTVTWKRVPNPVPRSTSSRDSTRNQVAGTRRFNGGEGCWWHEGKVYFTTKGDDCVWSLEVKQNRVQKIYDASSHASPTLDGVDNLVAASNGVLYVAEDGGNMQVCLLGQNGKTAAVLQLVNQPSSELTGVAFSPDGSRLYFSSQRGTTGSGSGGITYEVSGPFLSLGA